MKIGFVINNIIRDNITQLKYAYELQNLGTPPEGPINPYELDKYFPINSEIVNGDEFNATINDEKLNDLAEQVNFKEHKNVYTEKDLNDIYEFMYLDGAYEVFARAEEYKENTIYKLNQLNEQSTNNSYYLVNVESPQSKGATLVFLSTKKFNLDGILFPSSYQEAWNNLDVIVTDHPDILACKPEGKIAIKYTGLDNKNFIRGYNEDSPADYVVNSIGEIFNNEIINS